MSTSTTNLKVLSEEQCLRLIESHHPRVGRLAFADEGDRVLVLPINYRWWNGSVVFRTDPGAKLDAVATGRWLTFEVDQVDAVWRDGWSVLLQGQGHEITDPAQLTAIDELGLWSWGGASLRTIRLVPEKVSGRRIT